MQRPYVFIPGLKSKVINAMTFDGKKVKFKQQDEGVFIYTDGIAEDADDTVLKMEVK
jgi:alpha-L-fucosidase